MRLSEQVGALDDFLLRSLQPAARARCVLYLDDRLRLGQAIGSAAPGSPHPHWLAFVDLKPGAPWMHPCCYLVIEESDKFIAVIPSDRPPGFGALPESWQVVWRAPGIEAGQVAPMIRCAP